MTEDLELIGFKEYRKRPLKIWAKEMPKEFRVRTKEGTMEGKAGDFLIIGIEGERYPCNKDIFKKTYFKDRVSRVMRGEPLE